MAYRWYRSVEGRSQPVSLESGSRIRQVGGSLYVGGALLRDSGRYVCVVNNSVGAERASTSLLVTTPLSAYMVPQQQTVDVGRSAQLNCSTEGYPQLAVSWLKDGQPLHTSSRVKLASAQTLRIEHVERSDRGMYQCVVSNNEETAQGTAEIRLGGEPFQAAPTALYYPCELSSHWYPCKHRQSIIDSSPVLVSAFSSATLQPGDTWSAQCEAAGSPLPSVSWLLDGQSLHSSAVPGERRVEVGRHPLVVAVTVQAGGVSVTGRLSLSGLRTTDAGVYECVASNAVGEARHAAPLHVLGPPHVRPMRDARLVAREDATFHCRVTGYPISEVHWEREGKVLPENHRQQVFPNGTLVIKDVRKHADEGGYVCVATNPQGQTSRSKMNVQIMEAPEIDPIVIKRDLQLGMRMRLVCVVSKGDFPIRIQWLKDGSPIPEDQDIAEKILDEYSSTLSFSSLAVKHNGNYTCHASNAAASRNYSVEVIVNVPPTWRVEPHDMEVIAGQRVMLACAAEGSPAPHIHWMKDTGSLPPQYQELDNTRMNYKILQNGSLLIHSVQPDDRGYYLCQASNGIDSGLSKVAHLSVHVPPRFSTHTTNVTVPKGSTAILNCTVAADKPISVTWYQNNHELKPKQHPKINIKKENTSKGVTSTLMFKHVRREDTSSFICVASNKYGKDQLEMKLIVQETPEPPTNVRVNNFTSRSVSLSWEQPYNGNSAIGAYIVQYKNTTVPWHQNVVQVVVRGDQLNVTLKDLKPANGYQFQIRAENSVGVSNASETVTLTTLEEIPEAPPRDIEIKVKDSKTLLVTWKQNRKNWSELTVTLL
ncbi:Down syndrome cell adhesion molecule-like protein Dscam2 [Schistocerca serialis cubense]|uniref:Down syndrome cell adhesion molecule-like protein Dscam2 n=1 Tax=Schistocerca serialis cubense TaxID=2023355 RepID=UPI00214E25D0|nr:Down syndrome cell adhesion molecule-like protein Dscam2 [Schistocerca serialis cubense]